MATILDQPVNSPSAYPSNIPVSPGANRGIVLALIPTNGAGSAYCPTAVTFGDQPFTRLALADDSDSTGTGIGCSLWGIDEGGIAAAEALGSDALSVTGGSGTAFASVYFTVQAAGPIESWVGAGLHTTNDSSGAISLARQAGSLTLGLSAHKIASSTGPTLTAPAKDSQFEGTNLALSYGIESDTARTADFTWSTSSVRANASSTVNIPAAVTSIPGIPSNTLEYQGSPVTAATATFSVHAGTDLKATADYRITGVALTSGVFESIDLSGTSIAVGDPILVVVKPSTGPGYCIPTTAGDIA